MQVPKRKHQIRFPNTQTIKKKRKFTWERGKEGREEGGRKEGLPERGTNGNLKEEGERSEEEGMREKASNACVARGESTKQT